MGQLCIQTDNLGTKEQGTEIRDNPIGMRFMENMLSSEFQP